MEEFNNYAQQYSGKDKPVSRQQTKVADALNSTANRATGTAIQTIGNVASTDVRVDDFNRGERERLRKANEGLSRARLQFVATIAGGAIGYGVGAAAAGSAGLIGAERTAKIAKYGNIGSAFGGVAGEVYNLFQDSTEGGYANLVSIGLALTPFWLEGGSK